MREFRPLLAYLPRHRKAVLLGMGTIPFARLLDLAIPWIIGRGVDELSRGELTFSLRSYFLLLVGLALVKGTAKYLMRYLVVGASRRFEQEFRDDIYRHILTLSPRWFQQMRSGDLMARMTWDVEAVRMLVGPGMMYITETLFMLPAILILGMYDWFLAALVSGPLALIVFSMYHYAGQIHEESTKAQERLSDLSSVAQENFAGVRVVRAFAGEEGQAEKFRETSAAYCEQGIRAARVRGRNWTLMLTAKDLGLLILLSAGCYRLMIGQITIGQFWVFMSYLGLLFWPMVALGWMVGMVQRGRASMRRLNAILAEEPAIRSSPGDYCPDEVRGEIEFKNLRVTLGGREVLCGIDLRVEAGTVLGLTGSIGAGRSTLAQVLPRLVDVEPGQAFLDGVDVTRWDVTRLRRSIGFVPQEAFLFADSLRANLALGREDGDEEAIWRALRSAKVEQEFLELPRGLDSVVGERGVTLSGGQRQRATIARALAAEPAILIFDDCLSAVDAETEAEILKDLTSAMKGKSCILISHRVSALSQADTVCVLKDGMIVEQGRPDELLERGGSYRDLYLRQQDEDALERS
ncbi:MAG: ABC transporter ATP-binding protein [Planctomycetota bacterium]